MKTKPSSTTETVELRSFYFPHARRPEMGQVVNHKTGEVTTPPSMTKQSFVKECDINNIIKSFKVSGQITHMRANAALGSYADLPDPIDFQDALHVVKDAQASFSTLPAKVRDRFGNDPVQFLAFMADPENQDEIIKLGLATDNRPPAAPAAPPVSTPNVSQAPNNPVDNNKG